VRCSFDHEPIITGQYQQIQDFREVQWRRAVYLSTQATHMLGGEYSFSLLLTRKLLMLCTRFPAMSFESKFRSFHCITTLMPAAPAVLITMPGEDLTRAVLNLSIAMLAVIMFDSVRVLTRDSAVYFVVIISKHIYNRGDRFSPFL